MSDSVITSAYCNLPPELHGSIFAYLRSPADRSALAASCRFLRQWRGLAWQRIEINAKRIDALLLQVRRLVRAMRCDDELPLFVQEVYVRGLGVYPKYSRLWHDFLDGNIAQILRLAINLHTFVFDAPIADGNETYEHILSAMASLPSLRSISLNNLGGSGDDAIVSLPSINSNVLERFIIGMGSAVDITSATKDQLQLKYLHFELCWESTWDPVCTLQMMSSWVSLEEIVLCTDHESFFAWDAWLDMLEKALVCYILGDVIYALILKGDLSQDGGILRNLRTLSIEGPDSQQDLSNLLAILHKHNVPVSNFRFLVDDADFEILDGFGASSLEEVFDRLPSLETLCVDQFNHNNEDNSPGCEPLPGEWVSVLISPRRSKSSLLPRFTTGRLLCCLHAGFTSQNLHSPAGKRSYAPLG